MGRVTQTVLALLFAFTLVGLFMGSLMDASTDPQKQEFSRYKEDSPQIKSFLDAGNVTYNNTDNTVSNIQLISLNIQQEIATAQRSFQESTGPLEQITSAFGLLSSLTMEILFLFLAIIAEGANFVAGIGSNISLLPAPWNGVLAIFVGLGTAAMIVYLVLRVVAIYTKTDV